MLESAALFAMGFLFGMFVVLAWPRRSKPTPIIQQKHYVGATPIDAESLRQLFDGRG